MPISTPPPSWASIKNKPNTVAGFGITDMAAQSVANAVNATNASYATNAGNSSTVSTITTAQVTSAQASASVGAVGTYAFLAWASGIGSDPSYGVGSTYAGSSLRYRNTYGSAGQGAAPAGTWRCMGQGNIPGQDLPATVWLRIA